MGAGAFLSLVLAAALPASFSTPNPANEAPGGARATGTVTITGHVSAVASLQFYRDSPVGHGVSGRNGTSGSLDYTLDLGDLSRALTSGAPVVGGSVTLLLRSNAGYTLAAEARAVGLLEGDEYVKLDDFGFAVPSGEIRPSGRLATSRGTRLPPSVDADLFRAPAGAFLTTLSDLSNGMQLLRGETISHRGTLGSPENGLLVTTQYALRPQLFRPQPPFAVTVTYTLATP